MSYREKIDQISKEAFQEAKRMLMENDGRTCIYFSEDEEDEDVYDDFTAIVSPGIFVSEYTSTVKGVRLSQEEEPSLEVNYIDEFDKVYWTDAANMDSLFYSDMADFVKRNIDKAITPEECEQLCADE